MQIITKYAASDAARSDSYSQCGQSGPSSAIAAAATTERRGDGIGVRLAVRPDGRMWVRFEPDTGADTPSSRSCTSAPVSVHDSGSRRNPLWGSRVGEHGYGGSAHD